MSEDFNPYIAPSATIQVAPPTGDYYVQGKDLVCREGAVLPQRCVKTNEPLEVEQMKRKTFYWAHPAVFALILINILILIIVYFCIRKSINITYGMSKSAQARRTKSMVAFWLVFLSSFAAMVWGFATEELAVGGIGLIGLLISILAALVIGSALKPVGRNGNGEFRIRGCCPAFLASIEHETKGEVTPPPMF